MTSCRQSEPAVPECNEQGMQRQPDELAWQHASSVPAVVEASAEPATVSEAAAVAIVAELRHPAAMTKAISNFQVDNKTHSRRSSDQSLTASPDPPAACLPLNSKGYDVEQRKGLYKGL